jgi:predicted porin
MSAISSSISRFVKTSVLAALLLSSAAARAELVISDKDGWKFYTTGQVAAHYQFITGEGDPVSTNLLVGGKIWNNVSQDENNELAGSRIRSGFIGTQIGFGLNNHVSEMFEAKSFLSVSLIGIDNAKGASDAKAVDFREAWAGVGGPWGTFRFGRMFSIFGSASGEVVMYAYHYGVGHPCQADISNISCGSSGAGPLYAGYNAQLRYESPRLAGFGAQVAASDPSALPDFHITPLPRFEGELSYEATFASDGLVSVKGQGIVQKIGRLNEMRDGTVSVTAWGGMGAARFELAGFKVGAGAWTGKGMGTHTALQQDNQANPLAHDKPGGGFPGDELRNFRGLFGNMAYGYRGSALAVGGGAVNVQETDADASPDSHISLIRQNMEFHVVFTQRIHSLILSAEYMHWKSEWFGGEEQTLDFAGAGANFVW